MEHTYQPRIFVHDLSYVGAARRLAREFASKLGLQNEPLERLSIIATEMATNLAKHATGGGEILLGDASTGGLKAARIISVDRGPGIENVDTVMLDGFSTAATLGAGMGSLKRLSDCFEVDSRPGKGTVIHCVVKQSRNEPGVESLDIGAISTPAPNEARCGDGICIRKSGDVTSILVVDGLGHGDGAAEASEVAIHTFESDPAGDLVSGVSAIHKAMTGTRGAALALAQIMTADDKLKFVGIGNIAARVYSRYDSKGCVSTQGIVGSQIGRPMQYEYEWTAGALLLLHSDGIKSTAGIADSRGCSASMLSAMIYRDHCRGNDDSTVLVVKDLRRAK